MKDFKRLFIIFIVFILGVIVSPYIRGHKPSEEAKDEEKSQKRS